MKTNPYSIFCIAATLLSNDPSLNLELDRCWEEATELYKRFLDSEFNDLNRSELDCINEFMNSTLTKHYLL